MGNMDTTSLERFRPRNSPTWEMDIPLTYLIF